MMLEKISKREGLPKSKLGRRIRDGSIVLLKNRLRDVTPVAVGYGVKTKVNANIGTSPKKSNLNSELKKAVAAVDAGADTIMDLSIGVDINGIRKKILKKVSVPVGTVPAYQIFGGGFDVSFDMMLDVIEKQAEDGVDFMTIHSGITRELVQQTKKRLIPITSRGGSLIAAWMIKNKKENPLYTGFESILDILGEYDVVLSLGDALRPGSIHDASDECQVGELKNLGRLTKKARKSGVQVIVEGPGHMPLDQIRENIELEKKLCSNAPYYVLGPLVTDVALGYDHITGAIGGALAAMYGADFLCYVTPSEHLGLPTLEDVREGVVASKIAAHAGDMVKLGDKVLDNEMSKARGKLDWDRMFKLSIYNKIREKYPNLKGRRECTMCGKYCALKIVNKHLK